MNMKAYKAWVARDKDGFLMIYNRCPTKNNETGLWEIKSPLSPFYSMGFIENALPDGIDPKWEDEEPIEVELKIEKL